MVWLSDWLRDIIAVILLAVMVELLLPNKAMLRYARLVVGLFILLTILSPILRLFQEDIGDRLDAGIEMWTERAAGDNPQMPTLEEIQRRAADMQEARHAEAARMTAAALEKEMAGAIASETGETVEAVKVALEWEEPLKQGKPPQIAGVAVTLSPGGGKPAVDSRTSDVEAVAPVQVDIDVSVPLSTPKRDLGADRKEFAEPDKGTGDAVRGVLKRGWGVGPKMIAVQVRMKGNA